MRASLDLLPLPPIARESERVALYAVEETERKRYFIFGIFRFRSRSSGFAADSDCRGGACDALSKLPLLRGEGRRGARLKACSTLLGEREGAKG